MRDHPLDFVALGDITIDAFIKLTTEGARVQRGDHGKEEICMNFGDKIPYETVDIVNAVGNSPNAAVSASRLGVRSALVTDLGDDRNGDECIASLKKDGVATDFITRHEGKKTNYHYVLRYEEERTILIKHEEYSYSLPDLPAPAWVYVSSFGENSVPYHHEIAAYLEKHPRTKLAFQPGTFQIKLGYEKLKDLYAVTELFFCNVQEAQRILETPEEGEIVALLKNMHEKGPTVVVITDGPRGAYTYDGSEMWHMPMYPDPSPPVDRTGAGDSFASTFTSALVLGKTIPEALSWGPINSMSVVQYIGAQKGLLSRDKLETFLKNAPEAYKPRQVT
jgi:ribokinase